MGYINKTLYVSPDDVTVWTLNDNSERGPIKPRTRDGESTFEWTGKSGKRYWATVGIRQHIKLSAQDKAHGCTEYEVLHPVFWGEIDEDGEQEPPSGQIEKVVLED